MKDRPMFGRRGRRLVIVAAVLALVVILLWPGLLVHDWNLWRLSRSYSCLGHPPGTKRVAFRKDLGLLVGNGNHCDYFIGEVRSYQCPSNAIRKFYDGKSVWNPFAAKKMGLDVVFFDGEAPLSQSELVVSPDAHGELTGLVPAFKGPNKYYIVYILDPGYDPGMDIRCM